MPTKPKSELARFTEKHGYNKIFTAIEEHIAEDVRRLDIEGNDITLSDLEVYGVRNLRVGCCVLNYDVATIATISYTDMYRDSRESQAWFRVAVTCEIDETLKCFEVGNIEEYQQQPWVEGDYTDNLVPVISKPQMDLEARIFLQKHCPIALYEPTKVPIRDITTGMGLKLEFGYILSEDFSYLGQISFSDTKTRVFDFETGATSDLEVSRGTILIDPGVFWERSSGCENFTIAHEVVHWEKHKLFADLKRLIYREGYKAHRCPKPERILWDNDTTWTDEEWLEWHANGIGARILMPKETVKTKVDEIVAGFDPELFADKNEYFITLINELAEFYGVARLTAKIRLKELGFEAVDDVQIHEYDFQAYTHEIDEYKAFYEVCESPELRMLLGTGMFTYADNHFVINHKKCVAADENGIPHLTDFAWANIEKCTLKFTNVRINIKQSDRHFSDILYRGKTYETFQKYIGKDNKDAFEFARELATDFQAKSPERTKLSVSFADRVRDIVDAKSINEMSFQNHTLLSKATFHRLQKEDSTRPTFHTVLAFCAGLDLDIALTTELLGKAGHTFDGSEAHNAYMMAITHFAGQSLDVRNEFLRTIEIKGVKLLGDDTAK